MGTYYPSSSAEIDVLSSSPYTQDQKFATCPDSNLVHNNMMMYLNPTSSNANFFEISSNSPTNPQNGENFNAMSGRNKMMFISPTGDSMDMQAAITGPLNSGTVKNVGNSVPGEFQFMSRNHMGMMEGEQTLEGLSLSLNTQMSTAVSTPAFQYQFSNPGLDVHGDGNSTIRFGLPNDNSQFMMISKGVNCNQYQYEHAGTASALLKSKHLKAAQQLLDEIVSVRDAVNRNESGKDQNLSKVDEGSKESKGGSEPPSEANKFGVGSGSRSGEELSSAERQELQDKLDKLHSMLDEIDRRYKQYCHQMQVLVSSFDVVAGVGAAKPYTALALKTISRHFRCLRDAITDQIQVTRKSLGESENSMGAAIPRLRYVDQKIRQQRALQQFGVMRHAWRPQRGLPETAVTILRAWLFEHFLHPYPKDSEKLMLARQTGLTRGQVANWFINARVRLWKPMVEEMYKEEFGDAEMNCSEDNNTLNLAKENSWRTEDKKQEHDMQESSTSMAHEAHESKINLSSSSGPRINSLGNTSLSRGFYTNGSISADPNGVGNFMVTSGAYQMSELGNFRVGSQVSLDLGLRHQEEGVGTHFQGNAITESTMGVGSSEYPYLEQMDEQQNRFGNPHILNDFIT